MLPGNVEVVAKFRCGIGDPLVDGFEALVDGFESLVDGFEATVDGFEALVDSIEALVDSIEALIDSIEVLIDRVEALIEALGEAFFDLFRVCFQQTLEFFVCHRLILLANSPRQQQAVRKNDNA